MKKVSPQFVALIALSMALLLCSIGSLSLFKSLLAHAEEITFGTGLYSSTNTFNATEIEKKIIEKDNDGNEGTYAYKTVSYDVEGSKNEVIVDTGDPQVTFLTHGYNGHAFDWSNDGKGNFAPSDDSIFDYLKKLTDYNLYLAKFEADIKEGVLRLDYNLYPLKEDDYSYDQLQYAELYHILDNSKHSVVVFEAALPKQTNDFIYAQFNYMASQVLSDLKALNGNKVPRVNLVGHSRGGLTNLQYALDHPDLVDSIFSIATPYQGSTIPSLDNFIGGAVNGGPGESDIVNPEIYLDYLDRWNSHYDELYNKINVYAVGAYQSLDMALYEATCSAFLINDIYIFDDKYEDARNKLKNACKLIGWEFGSGLDKLRIGLLSTLLDIVLASVYGLSSNNNVRQSIDGLVKFFELCHVELHFNWDKFTFDLLNDLTVSCVSQLGVNLNPARAFKGFHAYTKRYDLDTYCELDKSSASNMCITHLIEQRDKSILTFISSKITLSNPKEIENPYVARIINTNDREMRIEGYMGESGKTLQIPSSIVQNGLSYTVTEIGDGAFSNFFDGVEEIVIPATVQKIGNYAFAEIKSLKKVTFAEGSQLSWIGYDAFNGCSNLRSFNSGTAGKLIIPEQVQTISRGAFSGTDVKEVHIGRQVFNIEDTAFAQISSLMSFTVDASNTKYKSVNGHLMSKDGKFLQYAVGKSDTVYTLPSDITVICEAAFSGAKNLQRVGLTNVETVMEWAFAGCTQLATVQNGNRVQYVGNCAFYDTSFLNGAHGCVMIGNVLYQYKGSDEVLYLSDNITGIAPFAFFGNEYLKEIVLPESVRWIGEYSLSCCSQLTGVYMPQLDWPTVSGELIKGANQDLKFYVARPLINGLANGDDWYKYRDYLEPIKTVVYFEYGTEETVSEFYYDEEVEFPRPALDKFEVTGWREVLTDENGNVILSDEKIQDTVFWTRTDKIAFFRADLKEKTKKYLSLVNGDPSCEKPITTVEFYDGDVFELNKNSIIRNGNEEKFLDQFGYMNLCYYNKGWYDNANGRLCSFEGWYTTDGRLIRSDKDLIPFNSTKLYAHWKPIEYTCYFNSSHGESLKPVTYNFFQGHVTKGAQGQIVEKAPLPILTDPDYRMLGWKINGSGSYITSLEGRTENLYLYADWAWLYTLRFNLKDGKTGMTTIRGIMDEVITLPYYVSTHYGYNVYWGGRYLEGTSYTITKDETLNPHFIEKPLSECYEYGAYYIYTFNQFNSIRNISTNAVFNLMEDITCNGTWVPIPSFYGTLNGNGHTIDKISISVGKAGNYGLFALISNGTINNLTLNNITINCSYITPSNNYDLLIGGLAGYVLNSNIKNCTIKNLNITVGSYYSTDVGAFVGLAGNTVISGCTFQSGSITSCAEALGGIVGYNGIGSKVEDCTFRGTLNYYYSTDNGAVGGIVGRNVGEVFSNMSYGYINYTGESSSSTSIQPYMASVIGYNQKSGKYSGNTASATCNFGTLKKVGGFLGIGAHDQKAHCTTKEVGYDEN